ncbi:hypothetical protein ABZV65_19860 [Streptomyces bauhiniae]|uniref:hypothetical protein n=1 Tax=Streptomyces bauhiniae TaxID=2340725 RepID=UPI0033AFB4A0
MTCQSSPSEVAAYATAATVLYAVTVLPLMRLARADHLLPRWVRALPTTLVGLLLLLTIEVSS